MLDSQIGLWRVLSQSFPHKAYSYLSIPVPALANKANAYLSNLLGVGAFNFFPSPSSLSIKVLIRPAFHLSIHEAIITQSKPNNLREENVFFFFHRARESHFFLYKLQWCEGERWGGPLTLILGFSTRRRKRQLARPALDPFPVRFSKVGVLRLWTSWINKPVGSWIIHPHLVVGSHIPSLPFFIVFELSLPQSKQGKS